MAQRAQQTTSTTALATQADGQVSTCISQLISAFTNGLNIFKRLRDRRRKRKSKKHRKKNQASSDSASSAELQLSTSLRRGPQDIKEKYDDCYGIVGKKFAKGDTIAHASLTATLVKLNNGFVNIIETFLKHGSKNSHLDLDYKSLTNLSDSSRKEALQSLNQLCLRLSQSQLQIQPYRPPACPNCGSTSHQECTVTEKRKHTASKQRSSGHTITRIQGKGMSGTQLVVMRPKNSRKGSSSRTSSPNSGKSRSPASNNTPYDTPLASPLPQYSPIDPMVNLSQYQYKVNNTANASRRRAGSFDGSRPTTWPHTGPDTLHLPTPTARKPSPSTTRPTTKSPLPTPTSPIKRRLDKPTPSTYTFASDSTKLGEIPQRNWTVPWDAEEAERLNAQAALYVVSSAPEGKTKGKRGLFGFLRRGTVPAS